MGQSDREENGSAPIPGSNTVVLVIGSLGDIVKKIVETELLIAEAADDRSLLLELASLQRILERWPVLDKDIADMMYNGMRLSAAKLKAAERELEEGYNKETTNTYEYLWLRNLISETIKRRKEIRRQMAALNKLSGGVGKANVLPESDFTIIQEG